MATDSTELTFVRCSSCRSLVPAVSTRCRMCGATLDASQKGTEEEDGDPRKSGRVRQRTMSQPDSELSSAADKLRHEGAPVEEAAPDILQEKPVAQHLSPQHAAAQPADDPLSAYIEEVEVADEQNAAARADKPADIPGLEEELTAEGPELGATYGMNAGFEEPEAGPDPLGVMSEPAPAIPEAKPAPKEAAPARDRVHIGGPAFDSGRARVVVESGNRRQGKGGGLSFGRPRDDKPRDEKTQEEKPAQKEAMPPRDNQPRENKPFDKRFDKPAAKQPLDPDEEREARDIRNMRENREHRDNREMRDNRENRENRENRGDNRDSRENRDNRDNRENRDNRDHRDRRDNRDNRDNRDRDNRDNRESRDRDSRDRDNRDRDNRENRDNRDNKFERKDRGDMHSGNHGNQNRSEEKNKGPEQRGNQKPDKSNEQPRQGGSPKREEAKGGRLFGWFISYKNPIGSGTEFREGGFFVSKSSLKPADLILDDPSISLPHALVSASIEEGLRVQDLMSEQGVFVKRRDSHEFNRISDVVKLEHGDSVRFGEVEFVICLVADVDAK